MTPASHASPPPRTGRPPANWRHGLQLAAAVVISYAASMLLGLPESLWAVMSSLIVMRSNAAATLGAGSERMRGTLAGSVFGLCGIWLHHLGLPMPFATLGIVAMLALSSAWFPAMRSAPISALIVLSSAGVAGTPVLRVAGLRMAEITIGVATGLAISLIGKTSTARLHFDAACAALLRRLAADVRRDFAVEPPVPQQTEKVANTLRLELRELAVLAANADQDGRFSWRARQGDDGACTRRARLLARTSHDATLFARLVDNAPLPRHDVRWRALGTAVSEALETTADGLESGGRPDLAALRPFCAQGGPENAAHPAKSHSPIPWIAPAARLLLEDLTGLSRDYAARPA